MALVKCHECGKEVSTEAAACPSCGAPVQVAQPGGTPAKLRTGWSIPKIFWLGVAALLVGAYIKDEYFADEPKPAAGAGSPQAITSSQQVATAPKLTATQGRLECRLEQELDTIMYRSLMGASSKGQVSADALATMALAKLQAENIEVRFSAKAGDVAKTFAAFALMPMANVRDAALEDAGSFERFEKCREIQAVNDASNVLIDVEKTDWDSIPSDKLQSLSPALDQSEQAVRDMRAAAWRNLMKFQELFQSVMIGFSCQLVDEGTASVAKMRLETAMQQELSRAGMVGDDRMGRIATNIENAGLKEGQDAVAAGLCDRMTGEQRGSMRIGIGELAR